MIFFNNVTKIYPAYLTKKEKAVLDDVSFKIEKGEFVCIVGRSGAGKTTLFRLLIGEEKPTSGSIFFDGEDVNKISSRERCNLRRRVGTIFQDYKLLPTKTIYENIAYALEVTGTSDEDIEKFVPEALDTVGLLEQALHFPHQISGGEKQRTAIARALIHNPDVILADEPTGDLDPYNTRDVLDLLLTLNEAGTTVILATHDKEVVNGLGKRVITIKDGKVISDSKKGRFIL
jgi:cell division transport system ATP-binding protein